MVCNMSTSQSALSQALGQAIVSENNGSTTLDQMPLKAKARVMKIDAQHPAARRLMEMGVVPGASLCVIRAAPLGDPLQVEVRGYYLAMRRAEAQAITVISEGI